MKSLKETEKKIVDLEVFMKNDMSSQNNKIDLCENKCKILQMENKWINVYSKQENGWVERRNKEVLRHQRNFTN